eukprot:12069729-Alexandrium_andersonii.AAC.1
MRWAEAMPRSGPCPTGIARRACPTNSEERKRVMHGTTIAQPSLNGPFTRAPANPARGGQREAFFTRSHG